MADKFLNAQVDEDTELWQQFEEFRESEGYQSKSEAVRAAVRRGLMDDEQQKGLVAGMLARLGTEPYELARDSIMHAALAAILHLLMSQFAPAAAGLTKVILFAVVAMAALGVLGAFVGTVIRVWDAVSRWRGTADETADETTTEEVAEA